MKSVFPEEAFTTLILTSYTFASLQLCKRVRSKLGSLGFQLKLEYHNSVSVARFTCGFAHTSKAA